MRLNIFSISKDEIQPLRTKLASVGMTIIHTEEQTGWHGDFYYSAEPTPGKIDWAESFRSYFNEIPKPENINYFAVYLFSKNNTTFAISYGKSHFYLRQYCYHDFGVEIAKRVANEYDIRQTSSKRFAGKRRKDIKSFTANSRLDVESGESVDYLQAKIRANKEDTFGKTGKFGSSALFTLDLPPSEIGKFLDQIVSEMQNKALFKLPRTTIIPKGPEEEKFNGILIDELTKGAASTEFTDNSYDLYGVDFVFPTTGEYRIWCPKYENDMIVENLSIQDLRRFIKDNGVDRQDILGIKISFSGDGHLNKFTRGIRDSLDYIASGDNVILSNGKWMRFNQDYIEFLDEYIDTIEIEEPEPDFEEINMTETLFNISKTVHEHGYNVADKDFSKIKIKSGTPVEAWDLHKENSVYAVKFGSAQKLGYVCDQATATLEIIRTNANAKKLQDFKKYVLWLGYESSPNRLQSLKKSNSLILKQKVESWARKARDLNITPVIKISRKIAIAKKV